jgi:hypothetical protein
MPTTSNFGWTTPADTDLVKDGALAIRTLGNGIDTSLVDLKGGTTGQILSKASNTDLDYTWINNDQGDITGVTAGTGISGGGTSGTVTITNSMATEITAAGDIIVGTGSGTFDNLPIGTTGQVLTADTTVSPYKVKWASASSTPTFVGWSIRRDTNVNITNDTATQVSFNDETLDSHSFHSTTVNPSRVTIPSNYAGKYLVFFNAGWAANSTGYRQSLLYKNGSGWGNLQTGPANATVSNYILGEMIIDLAVGDYLEVYVRQNSGGTLALNDNSYFNGIWLGA